MDDELEGIELRYLREKALKSMQKGSEWNSSTTTEPVESDFGIEKLLSETRSVSKVRKKKSTPEVSVEVSSFMNPVSSAQECRSESISSRHSTDKRSSSVSSQDSSHSSRTGSTSFSSSRSSDSRSSYSSSRSSSVTSSSSSRHKSPQSSRRIASPPKYRMKTSVAHKRHHRDWSPRRLSPRRPQRPPFNQSHTPSLRSMHYRHRSRSPVRMHHSNRRHSPSRGKLSHHYDDRTRHSYLPMHRNRSPLSSRIWHRSRRSPPRYSNREQHGQRDERRSYQSQKRLSRHISSIDRSPDSKLHNMKKLSHDSRCDQKKSSLSSNDTTVKEGSSTHLEQKRRKRQLHDSNDTIDQDANKATRIDIDNHEQQTSTSVGMDSLDEELDYDESMDSIDLHFFPEAEEKVEAEPEQKSFQSKITKESVSESSSKGRDISPRSVSPASLNDNEHSSALINSPIRLSPEPRKRLPKRISPSSPSRLHVKERLFLTKSDIERKKQTASHRSEHRLSSKLASRLGPSPATRNSHIRQSSQHRIGHKKGSAMAIADEYRRQKQKLIRRDEQEKTNRITSHLNEHQSKDKSPVKKGKDNNNEESLDKRIKRIKQKNKEILERSEEVEKDKHLYG